MTQIDKSAQLQEGFEVNEDDEDTDDLALVDDLNYLIVEEPDDEEHEDHEDHESPGEGLAGKVMIQVDDEEPKEYSFALPKFPGSDAEDDIEDQVEVEEEEIEMPEDRDMWDWGGVGTFMPWLAKMFQSVPHHNGTETAGLERAMAFLQTLDRSISKAVRTDLKDELDIAQIEKARDEIHNGIDRLEERLERVTSNKRPKKRKKADEESDGFVKEAQKITGVQGIMVTVPILISRIARTCINGMVSGGHDIEDIFKKQVAIWSLSKREQAETAQLLADMGYAIRRDRGFALDDDIDTASSNNCDWSANYPA